MRKPPLTPSRLAASSVALATGSEEEGFQSLFDGKDPTRGKLHRPNFHPFWTVEPGGILKNTVENGTVRFCNIRLEELPES